MTSTGGGPTGAEAAVRLLDGLGVEVVFGLCGDTSLPLYEALHDLEHGIRHVLTRDERSAAYMADAYARVSGRVGVCEGPSGGGATYILPGVAEANDSSVPLVCLTSDIATTDRGRGTLTELDQCGLFRPVTRSTAYPRSADELVAALHDAFRTAASGRGGAAHVCLPYDTQTGLLQGPEPDVAGLALEAPIERTPPEPDRVRAAVRHLLAARRPVIVAGAGVLRSGAWEELAAVAQLLGAPVATSISGKGALAETDPLALGVIGSNGGLPYRHEIVRGADVLLYAGCSLGSVTTEKWTLPAPGSATLLQIDVDPGHVGRTYPAEVALVADAKLSLAALRDSLDRELSGRSAERTDPDELARRRAEAMAAVDFAAEGAPVHPARFVAELSRTLPATSVLCVDPGTPCPFVAAYHRLPRAGRWFACPRAHGALGYALPAVVGARLARPDAGAVVGVMGDGSFGCSAGELETLVRLDLPVTLVVLNNGSYGWIKAGQRGLEGKYYSVDFTPGDHRRIAEAYGMRAYRVEAAAEIAPALRQALAHAGPSLVDVVVQPLEESRAPVSKWVA